MYIKVTVFPDFKKELVEKTFDGEKWNYKMYIREAAERGQANKKVISILEKDFPGKRVKIVTGALSTKKLIQIS